MYDKDKILHLYQLGVLAVQAGIHPCTELIQITPE
jgi:hypothetical protein